MRRLVLAALATVMVLGAGCSDDDKKTTRPNDDPQDVYLPRTSPENVLANLVTAYEARDLAAYRAQLDDPGFRFLPSPEDSITDFTELLFAEDVATTETMFALVASVELELTHDGAVPSALAEYPAAEGYRMIEATGVTLHVVTTIGSEAAPLTFDVEGEAARFIFKPDSSQTPPTYTIVFQQDETPPPPVRLRPSRPLS